MQRIYRFAAGLALCLSLAALLWDSHGAQAQLAAYDVRANYTKSEHQIPMRDGKRLFTVVYAPKDTSQKYPFLMERTPYSAGPYGAENYKRGLGPNHRFAPEGYIFVYQDVRGTFMSEGEFDDVRPFNANKKTPTDIDEASDTYDTVEWLLKNIPNHNGRLGAYGISYPGFYTTMTALADHPAIKAVSPQAPVTNWFIGDDDHRNGALFLFDAFGFNMTFG
ncbi:MAG: CocE/NonD family hydrolase, partial [Acidobacteria bacterium]|nr:CocE/NonD family hydrolase [Acidobacteriota bacterium]